MPSRLNARGRIMDANFDKANFDLHYRARGKRREQREYRALCKSTAGYEGEIQRKQCVRNNARCGLH